jgi:predicted metal-dependent phosphoesterase TrpH
MLFDMHVHSHFSDALMSPKDIVNRASDMSIGVSITDHNDIRGSVLGWENARNTNVPFLPAVELGTIEGKELLLYFDSPMDAENFYKKEIEPFLTRRMTRINRKMDFVFSSGLKEEYHIHTASFPHPYAHLYKCVRSNRKLTEKMLKFCDAVEVMNGHMSVKNNKKALNLSRKNGKRQTAGSDAHMVKNVGSVLIEFGNVSSPVVVTKQQRMTDAIHTLIVIGKANFRYSIKKAV